jgi:hypothetical protein
VTSTPAAEALAAGASASGGEQVVGSGLDQQRRQAAVRGEKR